MVARLKPGILFFNLSFSMLTIKKLSHCLAIPDDHGSGSTVIYNDITPLEKTKNDLYFVTLSGI